MVPVPAHPSVSKVEAEATAARERIMEMGKVDLPERDMVCEAPMPRRGRRFMTFGSGSQRSAVPAGSGVKKDKSKMKSKGSSAASSSSGSSGQGREVAAGRRCVTPKDPKSRDCALENANYQSSTLLPDMAESPDFLQRNVVRSISTIDNSGFESYMYEVPPRAETTGSTSLFNPQPPRDEPPPLPRRELSISGNDFNANRLTSPPESEPDYEDDAQNCDLEEPVHPVLSNHSRTGM